jgi:hypothetical protein
MLAAVSKMLLTDSNTRARVNRPIFNIILTKAAPSLNYLAFSIRFSHFRQEFNLLVHFII